MKVTSLIKGALLAAAAVAFSSCGNSLDTERVPMSSAAVAKGGSVTQRLDRSLNAYRQSIGKKPIQRHASLDRLAYQHCVFMAKNRGKFSLGSANISHYGFEERALMAQRRFGMESVAENVAGGHIKGDVAGGLVKAWTASKKHRYNLTQNWDATGIGVYVADDGMVYATQIFATQNNSQMTLTDRFRQF